MAINITDPSYITEHMLDKVVKEKFNDNADDTAVRNHAIKFSQIFRASRTRDQNIVDILHASQISRRDFKDGIAEIGCLMGMQYGFELALSFPPLQKIGFGISCARSRVEVFLQLVAYPFVNGMRCPWIMAFRRQLRQPEALLALLSASPL